MGEKIKLLWPEVEYELPEKPKKETDYLFHEFKKEDQYWRRPKIPKPNEWSAISQEQRFRLVERERERRLNGVWCVMNGEEVYLTEKHYDHLVYAKFDYTPIYLDSQRHDWYFRDHVKKSEIDLGGLIIKPRRNGWTDGEVTDNICEAIDDFNKYVGMTSDTKDKVYSTLYDKIVYSFLERPKFVRPDLLMRNGLVPRKQFLLQSGKVSKAKSIDDLAFDLGMSLNSKIVPKALTLIGFDGDKLHKLTGDEIWKWKKIRPKAWWDKQKNTLTSGGDKIGYAMLLSTMGDDEQYEDSIKDGIEMWHESDPAERKSDGFTATSLLRYFVSGVYSKFGKKAGCLDAYGRINIDKAASIIISEREHLDPSSLEYLYAVRKFPLTIEEALGSALTSGTFDKARIQQRITIVSKQVGSERQFVQGELIEDNNDKVHFVENSNEPWLFHKTPFIDTFRKIDKSNRFKKFNDRYVAPKNPEGVLGYDPVRYLQSDTTSNSISKASITGIYKFDYWRPGSDNVAGHRACLYLNRTENPEEPHFEAIKAAKFLNFMIQFERQVESFLRLCRELNFTDYLLKGDDGKFGIWTDSNKKVLKNGVDRIQKRWATPKGILERDYLMEEPFVEALEQARDFDPKKTTKFDFIMSEIMCQDGLLKIYESTMNNDGDIEREHKKLLAKLFPKRN